jgi:hypothetical protein
MRPHQYKIVAGSTANGIEHVVAKLVMPALVAGIHVFLLRAARTWMAGTSPAMTKK